MLCTCEKTVMADLSEHVESCSSTTKNIFPLPQCLWPPNLASWWLVWGAPNHKKNFLMTWSRKITWQIKNISTTRVPMTTKLGWMLIYRAPTHKVIWPFYHVVLWVHVTYYSHYVSTTTVPMGTKLDRMVLYLEGLLPWKSHDPLILWSCKITWQTKTWY